MGGSLKDHVQEKGRSTASDCRRCVIHGVMFCCKGASLHVVLAVAVGVPWSVHVPMLGLYICDIMMHHVDFAWIGWALFLVDCGRGNWRIS